MANVDKNQAVIDFLVTCPQIANNKLFFNFINGKDNDKQIITLSNDRRTNTTYVDGGVRKRFSFAIIDFRSVTYQAVVKTTGYPNENVEEMLDVQGILDWVNEQADARNFPNFGDDCLIDDMTTSTDTPNLNGVDTSINPAIAKYSISIFIDYIDTSKKLWR